MPQLEFPLTWHGKIIAAESPDIEFRVQETIIELGLKEHVRRGNVSSQGRYVTFNISLVFTDREMMVKVTETLAKVKGVRFVL